MAPWTRRGTLLVLVSIALLAAGCGEDAPDAATWQPKWDALVAVIPDQADIGSPPDQTLCRDTLATLREQSAELSPAPSTIITDLVTEWVSVAEAAFFGCPPESEDLTSFEDAYEELERIAESIETALANED